MTGVSEKVCVVVIQSAEEQDHDWVSTIQQISAPPGPSLIPSCSFVHFIVLAMLPRRPRTAPVRPHAKLGPTQAPCCTSSSLPGREASTSSWRGNLSDRSHEVARALRGFFGRRLLHG